MGNEMQVVWAILSPAARGRHVYARRTSPERGEFNIYGHLIEGEEHSYGFHVARVTNVPAAMYDETMANMVTLAEARYGNT